MTFPFLNPGGRRDAVTLLLITPTRLIRADFDGRPEWQLGQIWEARAPAGETLPVLVDAAFLLGPPRRVGVYVLASGVSTQILQVPGGKVAGLEGSELSNALSFEAEALSGINPFDSALSAVASGGTGSERSFWVTQMSQADLTLIQVALDQRKAVLRGVSHPGGLLRPVGHTTTGWQRVELWNDVVMCVDGSAPASPRALVVGSAPSRGMWRAQVDQWMGSQPTERGMMVADSSLIQYADGPSVSLDEEMILKAWLQEWVLELMGDRIRVPLVRPLPRPIPDTQRMAIAAGLALMAGAICVGHHFFLQHREKVLKRLLVEAERPAKEMAALTAQANSLQGQLDSVRNESRELRDLREFWKDTLDKEHRRHAVLLGTLARATPPNLAILSIHEHAGELHLTGLSLSPDVPGFATNIATAVEPFGWRIEPPRRRALELAEGGGPWKLDWSLRVVLPEPVLPGGTNGVPDATVGGAMQGATALALPPAGTATTGTP